VSERTRCYFYIKWCSRNELTSEQWYDRDSRFMAWVNTIPDGMATALLYADSHEDVPANEAIETIPYDPEAVPARWRFATHTYVDKGERGSQEGSGP